MVGQLNKFTFIFLVFFYSLELNAIEFKGKFEQGSFILGKTEPGSQVVIDKKKIRIGGMVKDKSVLIEEKKMKFIVTDFKNEINVSYSGAIPNLFAEGKGVVAEGYLKDRNFFIATKILAKHDENYMPPEVKEALKEK